MNKLLVILAAVGLVAFQSKASVYDENEQKTIFECVGRNVTLQKKGAFALFQHGDVGQEPVNGVRTSLRGIVVNGIRGGDECLYLTKDGSDISGPATYEGYPGCVLSVTLNLKTGTAEMTHTYSGTSDSTTEKWADIKCE